MKASTVNFVVIKPGDLLPYSSATNFTFSFLDESFLFEYCNSKLFENNLRMIDGLMPEIISEFIRVLFLEKKTYLSLSEIVQILSHTGNFRNDYNSMTFYKYKVKNLIRSILLGMNSDTVWNKEPNLYDYYPVIKCENEILYFGIDYIRFIDFVFDNTFFEISESIIKGDSQVTVCFRFLFTKTQNPSKTTACF